MMDLTPQQRAIVLALDELPDGASVPQVKRITKREVRPRDFSALVRRGLVEEVERKKAPPIGYSLTASGKRTALQMRQALKLEEEPAAQEPEAVSVREAARLMGLHRGSVYRAIARGEIPAFEVDGELRIPMEAVRRNRRHWSPHSVDVVRYLMHPRAPSLSPSARLVYLSLFAQMDGMGMVFPDVGSLPGATGLILDLVRLGIDQLQKAGLVDLVHDPKRGKGFQLYPPWEKRPAARHKGAS